MRRPGRSAFLMWCPEKVLMRRFDGTPRKRAEAEGVPRLMPRGAAQQSAPLVVVDARVPRPCVFSVELGTKGQFPQVTESDALHMVMI